MEDAMSEQLTRELIDRLAEVLGTTAPYVWTLSVRQQTIFAAANFVTMLVGITALTVGLFQITVRMRQWHIAQVAADPHDDDIVLPVLAGACLGLGLAIAVFWFGYIAEDSVLRL